MGKIIQEIEYEWLDFRAVREDSKDADRPTSGIFLRQALNKSFTAEQALEFLVEHNEKTKDKFKVVEAVYTNKSIYDNKAILRPNYELRISFEIFEAFCTG